MDQKEIGRIFYRDGYRLAHQHMEEGISPGGMKEAVGELYLAMDGLLEAFLQRSLLEGKPAACRKGCSWCCHQPVFAVTHELLYLHDHIREAFPADRQEGYVEKAREKAVSTLNRTLEEQMKVRITMPLPGGSLLFHLQGQAHGLPDLPLLFGKGLQEGAT